MTEKTIVHAALIKDKLLESLEANAALDEAIDEAEKQWQAFKKGAINGIPAEQVFPSLRKP